ncbi:hypothetical protein GCM10022408_07650 [Hymenobacter fastidiosus]|uniref:DUF983 domain-containing protein n=1 Tax=Hymenobacter fastidiosus TaxID=486264 RepID=A0ABP7RLL5_9BACT
MFLHSAFNLARFDEMPAACPACGQAYEPEVGFYWGAMYISYGFSVGIVVLTGILLYFLAGDPATWIYIVTVAAVVILLTPLMFRYARTMMLYFFGGVHYDAAYAPGPPPSAAGTPKS